MADRPEEGSKVESVDAAIVVTINAAVGGKSGEIVADLELALEGVKATHQVDLLLEDVGEGTLDVEGECVEAANAERVPVQGDVSQDVISAGKEHLKEVLEAEPAIDIGVEEADKAVGLALTDAEVALVAEEGRDLVRADKGIAVPVKSLESGVRCEVADVAEALASGLKTPLAVSDSDKQIL